MILNKLFQLYKLIQTLAQNNQERKELANTIVTNEEYQKLINEINTQSTLYGFDAKDMISIISIEAIMSANN